MWFLRKKSISYIRRHKSSPKDRYLYNANNVVSYLTLLNSSVSGNEGKEQGKNEELLFLVLNSLAHQEND